MVKISESVVPKGPDFFLRGIDTITLRIFPQILPHRCAGRCGSPIETRLRPVPFERNYGDKNEWGKFRSAGENGADDMKEGLPNIPHLNVDPYSNGFFANPYPGDELLREAGPVVYLDK